MILLLARTVGHSVQRDDGKCSSLRLTRNRFVLHRHPAMSLGVVETRLILQEDFLVLLLCPGGPGFWWMSSRWFDCSICDRENNLHGVS